MARYFEETDRLLARKEAERVKPRLDRLGVQIPDAVSAWYARRDAVEILATYSNSDRPVEPHEMTIENDRRLVVFLIENQGVCRWAFELAGDDPAVVVSVDREPWVPTRCSFSQFIWCQVYDWDESWSEDFRELAADPPNETALRFLRERFREGYSNHLWGAAVTRRFYNDRVRMTIRPSWVEGDSRVDWRVSAQSFEDLDEMLEVLAPFYDEER